jgi:GNAT superfamily N-acetyltransferase
MPQPRIKVRAFTGPAIKAYLSGIAKLRLEVYRDFPYLYEGSLHEETDYLKKYASCKDAIAVIIFDGSEIVGASLGIPLEQETDEVKKPFLDKKLNISSCYYFGESMLLKKYRGRGIGHHFFDEREAHVRKLGKFKKICFSCIARAEDDPRKPEDYISLEDFWKKRGYVKYPELSAKQSWPDIHEKKISEKPLIFWVKSQVSN